MLMFTVDCWLLVVIAFCSRYESDDDDDGGGDGNGGIGSLIFLTWCSFTYRAQASTGSA